MVNCVNATPSLKYADVHEVIEKVKLISLPD